MASKRRPLISAPQPALVGKYCLRVSCISAAAFIEWLPWTHGPSAVVNIFVLFGSEVARRKGLLTVCFSRSSRGGGSKYKLCTLSLILLLSNSFFRTRVSLDTDVINIFRNRSYYMIQNCILINSAKTKIRAQTLFLHDFPLEARRRWISCPLVA